MSELESKIYELIGISSPSDKTGFYMMCRAMQAHIRGEFELRDKLLDIAEEEHESRTYENKIKAGVIREAIKQCSPLPIGSPDDFSEGYSGYCEALCALQEYANKLEKGE